MSANLLLTSSATGLSDTWMIIELPKSEVFNTTFLEKGSTEINWLDVLIQEKNSCLDEDSNLGSFPDPDESFSQINNTGPARRLVWKDNFH